MGAVTVLVIDDEEMVSNISRVMLERLGYHVLTARNGNEAIDITKNHEGVIDVAILDIVLPDMSGDVLHPIIKEARPDMKVIVCSGYAPNGAVQGILDAGARGFLQKPFTLNTLSEKLQEVLKEK